MTEAFGTIRENDNRTEHRCDSDALGSETAVFVVYTANGPLYLCHRHALGLWPVLREHGYIVVPERPAESEMPYTVRTPNGLVAPLEPPLPALTPGDVLRKWGDQS